MAILNYNTIKNYRKAHLSEINVQVLKVNIFDKYQPQIRNTANADIPKTAFLPVTT